MASSSSPTGSTGPVIQRANPTLGLSYKGSFGGRGVSFHFFRNNSRDQQLVYWDVVYRTTGIGKGWCFCAFFGACTTGVVVFGAPIFARGFGGDSRMVCKCGGIRR